jgi:phosphohistidine phosphatase
MALQHLLLLRHGEAHHSSPDELRQLNDSGREEVEKTLTKALDLVPPLEEIFHSGLVRAMQTAEIAAEKLAQSIGGSLQPQYLDGITPWGDPQLFCKNPALQEAENLLVVTHNPFVEDLVEYLTGESLRIKTGSLICLKVDFLERGCCSLEWSKH